MSNNPGYIVDDVMKEFVKIKEEMIAQNNGRAYFSEIIDELKIRRPEYVPEVIDGIVMINLLFG